MLWDAAGWVGLVLAAGFGCVALAAFAKYTWDIFFREGWK